MKSLYKFIAITLLILINCTSCNEEITLETKFEPQIFIFGNLTNTTRNLKITIQESVPVENTSSDPQPVHNVKIKLFTKNNNGDELLITSDFSESNGEYLSVQEVIPTIGNSYWIEIELEDGTIYKSEKEILKTPIAIDKISRVDGFIRATFKDPLDDRNFYRLEITASNNTVDEITSLFSSDILFNGNTEAFIEEDIGLIGNIIHADLVSFNHSTFQFYINVLTQEDNQSSDGEEESAGPGQLFATPPVHLTGNIINVKTKKKALGNFGVVSISTLNEEL